MRNSWRLHSVSPSGPKSFGAFTYFFMKKLLSHFHGEGFVEGDGVEERVMPGGQSHKSIGLKPNPHLSRSVMAKMMAVHFSSS